MLASNLPRVGTAQPIVRLFMLPAVLDGLLEDAILVAQAIANRGQLHRRHGVEEAGGQTPKPAIYEAGVGFPLKNFEPVKVLLLDGLLHNRIEQKVRNIVRQRTPDEKLH